jgi:hypothetical protein
MVELSVLERIALLGILPREGNFLTLKILRQLREALSFSEEELSDFELRQEENSFHWNPKAERPKEVPIGAKAREIIAKRLEELDKAEKLTDELFGLYERFVEKGGE